MSNKKGYVVLEIGWEYNDEYYSTGNYGETYEAPQEIFLSKEKAESECLKKEINAFKGLHLASYIGEQDIDDYLIDVSFKDFASFLKETFDVVITEDDYYDLDIPSDAKDEDIIKLISMIDLRFFKIHEITITE